MQDDGTSLEQHCKTNGRRRQESASVRSGYKYSTEQDVQLSPPTIRLNSSVDLNGHGGNSGSPKSQSSRSSYFDGHIKTRRHSHSYSDSGTEADDEKGAFLSTLPAPPQRPRKGLKAGYGSSSPLLTPSYIDEATKGSSLVDGLISNVSFSAIFQQQAAASDREKFLRRRRAELARRITETALIGFVCYVTLVGTLLSPLPRIPESKEIKYLLQRLKGSQVQSMTAYIIAVVSLYALYPVRIILKNSGASVKQQKPWFYIYIPAAFEPAPLLYPVLIPVLIAIALRSRSSEVLIINAMLGLASVPKKIVPFAVNVPWLHSPHWLIAALPMLVACKGDTFGSNYAIAHDQRTATHLRREQLVCLTVLHQALAPLLEYLTSTSLLPAELQLMSIALINLLELSSSAQATILKALLWGGGISVVISCGWALHLEASLARVPSWRFRRSISENKMQSHSFIVRALDDSLGGRLASSKFLGCGDDQSDEDGMPIAGKPSSLARKKRLSSTDTQSQQQLDDFKAQRDNTSAKSRIEVSDIELEPHRKSGEAEMPFLMAHHRRSTLPSDLGIVSRNMIQKSVQTVNNAKAKSSQSWSFRSLTMAQAICVKWFLAVYTYTVIIVLILFPIRSYVSAYALRGDEPVGWALGYLFGDIDWFRDLINGLGLGSWVPLYGLNRLRDQHRDKYGDDQSWVNSGPRSLRLAISMYCFAIIAGGITIVLRLSSRVEVDTRRKVFHGMMVAMFLPTIFVDPTFISLAFILILAVFLLLDLFRASQLPPIARPLTQFLAPYVDGRDHRGPVVVSHIFLLIGCAIPLWLSLAGIERSRDSPPDDWEVPRREMSMISGVVCVGMGDAAASLIGRRFGRRRWPWTGGKSLEGSLAFAFAVILGLILARLWFSLGKWDGQMDDDWSTMTRKSLVAACGASLTEAVLTGGNDNVIVPIVLWLFIKGLEI